MEQKKLFQEYVSKNTKQQEGIQTRTKTGCIKYTPLDCDISDEDFVKTFYNPKLKRLMLSSFKEEEAIRNESFIFMNPSSTKKCPNEGFKKLFKEEPDAYVKARLNSFKKAKNQLSDMFNEYYEKDSKELIDYLNRFINYNSIYSIDTFLIETRREDQNRLEGVIYDNFKFIEIDEFISKQKCITLLEEELYKLKQEQVIILIKNNENIDLILSWLFGFFEVYRFLPYVNSPVVKAKIILLGIDKRTIHKDFWNKMSVATYVKKPILKDKVLCDIFINIPFNLELDKESLNLLNEWETCDLEIIERMLKNSLLDFFLTTPLSFILDYDNIFIMKENPFYEIEKHPFLENIGELIYEEHVSQFMFLYCLKIFTSVKNSNIYDEFFYFKKRNGTYDKRYLETNDITKIYHLLERIAILPDDIEYVPRTNELITEYIESFNKKEWNESINDSKVELSNLRTSGKRKYNVTINNTKSEREIWVNNAKVIINSFFKQFLECKETIFKKEFKLRIEKNDYSPDLLKETLCAIRNSNLPINRFLSSVECMEPKFTTNELWKYFKKETTKRESVLFNYGFNDLSHIGLIEMKKYKTEPYVERLYWE